MTSLYGTQFTDQWLANPWSTEPSQMSNQFSPFPNQALPYPPTYNPGLAGGPVNAATGQPIQSFLDWQKANPGGLNLNATPAAPQAAPSAPSSFGWTPQGMPNGGQYSGPGTTFGAQGGSNMLPPAMLGTGAWTGGGGGGGAAAPAAPQPQQGGAPNNWQAAINALAMPGKVQTMGATVPQATGSQPSGGVNQAWLNQIGSGQGMNQSFINALRGIQAR